MKRTSILRCAKRLCLLPNRETQVPTATYLNLGSNELAVYASEVGQFDGPLRGYGKWEPGFDGVVSVTILNAGRDAVFLEKWQELGTLVRMEGVQE